MHPAMLRQFTADPIRELSRGNAAALALTAGFSSRARAAASVRFAAPSLPRTWPTCF